VSEIETDASVPTTTEEGRAVEARGSTIAEAVTRALDELGISRDEAEIEVLAEGARAVPGERLSGSEARVRVRRMDAYSAKGRALSLCALRQPSANASASLRRHSKHGRWPAASAVGSSRKNSSV